MNNDSVLLRLKDVSSYVFEWWLHANLAQFAELLLVMLFLLRSA